MKGSFNKRVLQYAGLFFWGAGYLLSPMVASAQSFTDEMPIKLLQTRLILEGNERHGFLTIKNLSERPIMLSAVPFDFSSEERGEKQSKDILLSPPSKIIAPQQKLALRVVLLNRNLPKEEESLFYLRLKFIPSDSRNQEKLSKISGVLTLYTKVFYRPEKLISENAVLKACKRLTAVRMQEGIQLKNPSPYWMTIPNLRVDDEDYPNGIRAPMLKPFGELNLGRTGKKLTFNCVLESGYLSDSTELYLN